MQYVEETGSDCVVATYHLITDNDNLEEEKNAYIELVEDLGVKTEIWKMHNWSGVYDNKDKREGAIKTCGQHSVLILLFVLKVLMESLAQFLSLYQVLGRDEEAVLGHTSEKSVAEIWNDIPYVELREGHKQVTILIIVKIVISY